MIGHDDERVEKKFSLFAVIEDRFFEQSRVGFDLKKTPALGGDSGDEIGPGFLGHQAHPGSIRGKPRAEALFNYA